MRQWVFTLPFPLRFRMAYDAPFTSEILRIFVHTVFASLRRGVRKYIRVPSAQCGAVTFVQRFGDALNLNVHFHTLVLDGVYPVRLVLSPRPRFGLFSRPAVSRLPDVTAIRVQDTLSPCSSRRRRRRPTSG